MKKERAITLISLVITIILLILLAGVAINLGLGENGIFNKVKQAKEQYAESIAKEKLEMVLLDVIAEKQTNNEYNNGQFLDDMLKANGIEVQGDNVIIDNYIFELDRESLGITQSLGQAQIKVTKQVQKYLGRNANDKYEAQLLIIIESNTNLQKVEITNPDGTSFEIETEQERIAKDLTVEFDEEYKLEITDKTGKKETRTIVERTEEGIRTAEELSEFRDKANTGLTYEGKVINLLKNIDLSTVCGEDVNEEEISWIPIDTDFKGIFDGNYHTISNLYMKSGIDSNMGFFRKNRGKIKNIILKNVSVESNFSKSNFGIGLIVCTNIGTIENCGIENSQIDISNLIAIRVGGICAVNSEKGIIKNCFNKANIKATKNGDMLLTGGISADNAGTIINCYNVGEIKAEARSDCRVGGISGWQCYTSSQVNNCYNTGTISGSATGSYAAGIVGLNGAWSWTNGVVNNSYCEVNTAKCSYYQMERAKYDGILTATQLKDITETLNGEQTDKAWLEDTNNINNGYPILKWQVENRKQ